jgi:hypothetical protein
MKQVIIPVLAIFLCMSSYAQDTKMKDENAPGKKMKLKPEKDKMKMKGDMAIQPVSLPYTATYSSQFAMGNPAQAKMILDMYQAYEKNDFSGESRFSDTVRFILPDGQVLQGRDAVMSTLTQGRNAAPSPDFTINAVMPVHSVDKDADWVLVWGSQTGGASGSTGRTEFHSIWMVNKDQKVDYVQIYEGKATGQ